MRRRINNQTKAGILRDNFLKMRGGKLISIEAYVLGAIVFFAICIKNGWEVWSGFVGLFAALIVGFLFPILVGMFQSLAWLAAVFFSLIWAFVAFVFAAAMTESSIVVGLLAGVIFFALSFIAHKNYSGIRFQGISKKRGGQQVQAISSEPAQEAVSFCPKCGRRIRSEDGRCDTCDK